MKSYEFAIEAQKLKRASTQPQITEQSLLAAYHNKVLILIKVA